MSYPVQRCLWEGLESVFLANARNLLRDIANDVSRPEKELLKAFSKDMIKIHLTGEQADEPECCAITEGTEVATRCRKAVYRDTLYCPFHHRQGVQHKHDYGLPNLRRIKTESGDTYFLDPITQFLYTERYERIGQKKENRLLVFKIEEPSEDREET